MEMRRQVSIRDEHVNAGILQNKVHFLSFKKVIDGHGNRPDGEDAEQSRDKFRTVFEPNAHAVSGFDMQLMLQVIADGKTLEPQFSVRVLALAPIEGSLGRPAFYGI